MCDPINQDQLFRLSAEGIEQELMPPNRGPHSFYPTSLLHELIHERTVTAKLQDFTFAVDKADLVKFVCDHAKRIFALLVYRDEIETIDTFFEYKFTDAMLPVKHSDRAQKIESFQDEFSGLNLVSDTFRQLRCREWSSRKKGTTKVRDFVAEWQLHFVSPTFKWDQFRYAFHPEQRLPFFFEDDSIHKSSNFSLVQKFRIHRAHLQLDKAEVRAMSNVQFTLHLLTTCIEH